MHTKVILFLLALALAILLIYALLAYFEPDFLKWNPDTAFVQGQVDFILSPIAHSSCRLIAQGQFKMRLLLYQTDKHKLDKLTIELLLTDLSNIFFNKDFTSRIIVQARALPKVRATTSLSIDGRIIMHIDLNMAPLPGLSIAETTISVLLRELCVAFLHISRQDGKAFGRKSVRKRMIGEKGYGAAWLKLAAAIEATAPQLPGLGNVNLELMRWTRHEYIHSGLRPSEVDVEGIFGGEDPICGSVQKRRAEKTGSL